MFIIDPTTISGKVRLRTPLQADALSGKYIFNNLQNTEPNLGIPKTVTENSPDPDGKRYLLLSNNSYSSSLCSVSAWRVWSYNSPTIATWSKENSIALGDDALPIRQECLVYNNYSQKINRFNSEGFFDNTFNVFSMSGIYLFDPTTIGDPGSATSLIVTNYGNVGINTDSPNERLSINGNLSCTGTLSASYLYILNKSFLGNSKVDETTVRGKLKLGDMDYTEVSFGSGGIYDTNLYRGGINTLQTNSNFICNNLSAAGTISTSGGTSDQWSNTCTVVNSNSASWSGGGTGNIGTIQTYLSTNNVLLNGATVTGDISASGNLTVNAISSRFIDLLHTPANDGSNPVIRIGETDTTGFSGFNLLYNESSNTLQLVTDFGGVSLTAVSIDRNANVTSTGAISTNKLISASNGNSDNWNSAYTNVNFTSARDVQTFRFTSSPINIVGSPTYNLFTVPTGYRFTADTFQLTVIDAPAGAGTPSVQLQRASDNQSLSPTLPIPTGVGKFNVFSVANHNSTATIRNTAPPTSVVNLATTVNSAYTTLSCIAIIQGSLIPTSLYV